MIEELHLAGHRSVGTKQTTRALERGIARRVFVAKDAEERVVSRIVDACRDQGVEVTFVDTMLELGKACGIEVGAASAALLKE